MLTHDEIREELIRQVDDGQVKQIDVARKLGIAPARVSEMRRRARKVQQAEMPVLAEILGLAEPTRPAPRRVESTSLIANWGKVAQGVWLEQTEHSDEQSPVPYDRVNGDPPPTDLFAVTPEGTSMNQRFMPDTQLICRRIPFGTGAVRPGDYVIVQREAHELRELTCKRVEIDNEGIYWLHSESDDPRFQIPWKVGRPSEEAFGDNEIQIIGKVIRAVQDLERGRG